MQGTKCEVLLNSVVEQAGLSLLWLQIPIANFSYGLTECLLLKNSLACGSMSRVMKKSAIKLANNTGTV